MCGYRVVRLPMFRAERTSGSRRRGPAASHHKNGLYYRSRVSTAGEIVGVDQKMSGGYLDKPASQFRSTAEIDSTVHLRGRWLLKNVHVTYGCHIHMFTYHAMHHVHDPCPAATQTYSSQDAKGLYSYSIQCKAETSAITNVHILVHFCL